MLQWFDPHRLDRVVAVAVLAGVLGGLLSSLVLTVTGEPVLEDALVIEQSRRDPNAAVLDEVVPRDVQRGAGRIAAYAVAGGAFGILFGVAFVALKRRVADPFRRAAVAAAILAGAITVSPWFKYPPNPPAVGDPATLAYRQRLFLVLIVLSLALCFGALHLLTRLAGAGWPEHRRVPAVVAGTAIGLSALYALLPGAPDPVDMPATLVWRFRVASLGANLIVWTVLAVGVGAVAALNGQRWRDRGTASASPEASAGP